MRRLRTPATTDTTSEPRDGNGPPGAPVIASMSGGFMETATRVEPWNTACIPPLNLSGDGNFLYSLPRCLPLLRGGAPQGGGVYTPQSRLLPCQLPFEGSLI